MSDLDKIYSCLARMRNAMVKAHPENLGGSVSDVLECALCLESFQKELLEIVAAAQKEIEGKDSEIAQLLASIKGMKEGICVTCDQLAAKTRECEEIREALEEACEALHIQFDVIEILKIYECLPTEGELQQAMQFKNAARQALRPDSAKEKP